MESVKIARELANILNDKGLSRISFKSKDVAICVESAVPVPAPVVMQAPPMPPPLPPSTVITHAAPIISQESQTAVQDSQAAQGAQETQVAKKEGNYITSPIVGTFYAAPAPDKSPFVSVGDKVTKGQVVCIVESMKLMNEITSEFDGTVAAVLAMDGDAVDFGKELIQLI
jgi:acetyl-CoA carboxylase biotin carboxyl carrier protein